MYLAACTDLEHNVQWRAIHIYTYTHMHTYTLTASVDRRVAHTCVIGFGGIFESKLDQISEKSIQNRPVWPANGTISSVNQRGLHRGIRTG